MTRYTPLWEQAGSYAASVDRRLIGALWPTAGASGCAVTVSAGTMNMNVAAGYVAAPAANNTGSVLCYSDAVEVVTSPTAPAGGTNRYDVVVCQPRGNDLDGGANNDFLFQVVSGTASASPSVPATPAGAVALARILVIGGSASLSSANLTDMRPWFRPPANEPFFQVFTTLAGSINTAETWLGTIVVPNLPYPHRVRYLAQVTFNAPSTDAIDMRIRYNLTGAATALTDPIARIARVGVVAGNNTLTVIGSVDRTGAGGPSSWGLYALTSGVTATVAATPELGQMEVHAVPI